MRRLLAVVLLLSLAGCGGLLGSAGESWEHRIVVENGYASPATVTVSVDTPGAGHVGNETRHLAPEERWHVSSIEGAATETRPVTVTVSTATHTATATDRATVRDTGATLISIGDGVIATCGGNATCYTAI